MSIIPSGSIPGDNGGIWKMPSGSASRRGEVLAIGDPSAKTLVRQQPRTDAVGLLDGYMASLYPPPLLSSMWISDGDVTVFDSANLTLGERISPKAMFSVGGMYALLYQGNRAPSLANTLDSRLAWSSNLTDWEEGEIILATTNTNTWEGSRNRAIGLVFDTQMNEWVLFFEGNGGSVLPAGTKRAIGFAKSRNITGPYIKHASPVILSDTADISDWNPHGASNEVAYGMAVTYVSGIYYLYVMAGNRGTGNYNTGILTSESPLGPWVGGAHNPILSASDNWEDGKAWAQQPTFITSEQRWYLPYYNEHGQIGFAISANASQLSTWTKHASPVIEMTTQEDGMQNVVFPVNGGGWAALVAIGGNGTTDPGTTNTKVKLVTSHVEAEKIAEPLKATKLSIASKLAASQNLSDLANKTTATENLLDSQAAQAVAWDKLLANLPASAPVAGNKPWNNNGTLSISIPAAPIITGTAYPGETLTSNNVGVWTIGGVDVNGTSDTYVVGNNDIGKVIAQTAFSLTSDPATVWHPADEAGVKLVLLADRGAFISTGPDVPAVAHLDSVAAWRDQTSNAYEATQATSGNRPRFRDAATDGRDNIEFGTAEAWHLSMTGNALDLYRNINYGYMIASVVDDGLTAGETFHYPFVWARSGSTQARLALTTRDGTNFSVFSRATDGGNNTAASSPQVEGWNVITSEGAFVDGFLRIRVNGEQTGQTALPQSQATPDTASDAATIGRNPAATGRFPGRIACLIGISGASALSTAALARLERYAGLLIGKNIPLA